MSKIRLINKARALRFKLFALKTGVGEDEYIEDADGSLSEFIDDLKYSVLEDLAREAQTIGRNKTEDELTTKERKRLDKIALLIYENDILALSRVYNTTHYKQVLFANHVKLINP